MSSTQRASEAATPVQTAPRRLAAKDRLVLSPDEPLVEGGAAEEFERRVQALLAEGHRRLIVDLRGVAEIDADGIRALVRGYTTAQRLGGSFRLTGVNAQVRAFLQTAHLDTVFAIYESVDAAQAREWPWRTIALVASGGAFCLTLVWGGMSWPTPLPIAAGQEDLGLQGIDLRATQPFLELLKLVVAALIGVLVTAVHRPSPRDKPMSLTMEQAQILLCVSGAMMMIIIGGSLARAFGIAGAASIIRFRTPVDDPKDATILFLLMALGMACGLGAFAVAGVSTVFVCLLLPFLDGFAYRGPRAMLAEIVANSRDFPLVHVQSVFARHRVRFEPREVSQGEKAKVTYHTTLRPDISLEDLSADLMAGGSAGLKSVSWEPAKKSAS